MVDLAQFWPLKELPNKLPRTPRGKKIHRSTGFRWASTGVRGRRLRTYQIGGCLYTCDEWLSQFIQRRDEPKASEAPVTDEDAILAAEHRLNALGIK